MESTHEVFDRVGSEFADERLYLGEKMLNRAAIRLDKSWNCYFIAVEIYSPVMRSGGGRGPPQGQWIASRADMLSWVQYESELQDS